MNSKVSGEVKTYIEPEEVELIEKAATNLRDMLLIRLLFRLGCRVSEALALEIGDIDLLQGTVVIKHLKERNKLSCPHCGTRLSKLHTYCPGCSKKVDRVTREKLQQHRRRILPLDPETLALLKEYIDRGGPVQRDGKLLIFGINRHRAWQIIKQCAEKAGLHQLINPETGKVHNVSPHRLRDAFAVYAVKTAL
jgi:integrase/recombinase XerD